MLKRAVIVRRPQSEGAAAFAVQLAQELERRGVATTTVDVWADGALDGVGGAGLIVCIGGDGTVLRAARSAIAGGLPILGVNMGRLGFLTELSPGDLFTVIERVVREDWRIDERMMVRAEIERGANGVFHGLNDVAVSRQLPGRPIYVEVRIDGAFLGLYRCDGIVIATPTGSTGYSLSAGGPIMPPDERNLVLTPVSAHLALGRSLVLHERAVVDLRVTTEHAAALSVDGQEDLPIPNGSRVIVRASDHVTRFATFRDQPSFYAELARKLENQISSITIPRD